MERLERSEEIEVATPGYWIFTAMGWLVEERVARWTWPIEAAAMGLSEMEVKRVDQSAPRLVERTRLRWEMGM